MRLYTFEFKGQQRIGAERNGRLVDFSASPDLPKDMISLLRGGESAMAIARQAQASGTLTHAFGDLRLLAPVPRPGKILSSGINYRGHLEEEPGATLPTTPFFFSKLPSCVIGAGQPIVHSPMTEQLDYEVELAVVIGKTAKNLDEKQIMGAIAGYTIHHDASARDVQLKDHQITLGKNFDTFAPMGPCMVTADEISDPTTNHLRLRTWLNGQLMQDSSTSDWVFPLPYLLSFLNRIMTLEPGDIVSTGCPAGVGLFRNPPVYMKHGDVVRLEIEKIGVLENPVVAEAEMATASGRS
jgi:2,4-didehydro-3-deoxy-L-rhamnonate hydrolase